jgi:predicted adenine nucleotide alpha hydrolase (AANH) superfamily ATPase
VAFLYRDFRQGWKAGIEASKALGLYRQEYCGCLFSERDRFLGPRPVRPLAGEEEP